MNASAWYPHSFAGPPQGHDHEHVEGELMSSGEHSRLSASSPGATMRFQDRYPAVPESVAAVRSALEGFARRYRLPPETIDAVTLAASEAATNVVVHAYRDANAPGEIEVAAALAADELWVIVTDAGSGLRPRTDSPGLGLGLAIIAQVADGVDLVKPAAGGLELRMRFAVDNRA
jgi:serine/threonine-protein kinase RsbW